MTHLLSVRGRAELGRFVSGETLLAFDFDGTLAAIAARPEAVRLRARTRWLLRAAARGYHTAVITGRRRAEVATMLGNPASIQIVGNHGAEWAGGAEATRDTARVARWRVQLGERLRNSAGINIEDKGLSLSIHFRDSPDWTAAGAVIARAVQGLEGVRAVGGKAVVNLVPDDAADKGSALLALMRLSRSSGAVFVGDDVTDEDAFALAHRHPVMGVRVGRVRSTSANYYLRHRAEVDDLLELLTTVPLRACSASRSDR